MADFDTEKMLTVYDEEMAGIPSVDCVSLSSMRLVIVPAIAGYIFSAAVLGAAAGALVMQLAEWWHAISSSTLDSMTGEPSTTPAGSHAMMVLFLVCGVFIGSAVTGMLAMKWISRFLDDLRHRVHYQTYRSEINAAEARIRARRYEFMTDNDRP